MKLSVRLALIGLAALLSMTVAVQSAAAHAPTTSGVIYSDGNLCTSSTAQIAFDHTTKVLSASARTTGYRPGGYGCDTIDVWAPGSIAVRYDLYKWTGSTWAVCTYTNWAFNSTWTWDVTSQTNYGTNYPCGAGYYGTMSYSFIWDGAAWRGGSRWSNYHQVPV